MDAAQLRSAFRSPGRPQYPESMFHLAGSNRLVSARRLLSVKMDWLLAAAGLACLIIGPRAEAENDLPPRVLSEQTRAVERSDAPAARSAPTQVWWTDRPGVLLVFESGKVRLTELDATAHRVSRTRALPAGAPSSRASIPAPGGEWSAAIDPRLARVSFIDGDIRQPVSRGRKPLHIPDSVAVDANPQALAVTADSKTLLVACDATGPAARRVCLVDVETGKTTFRSVMGSSNLRGIAVDPQGKYALAVHLVPKSHLPSTQIEQGWVFTNAISFLSLEGPPCTVTLPLDLRTEGFANPEGVAITPDGSKAYVAHAGADVVSVIDLRALITAVEAAKRDAAKSQGANRAPVYPTDPTNIMVDDLSLTRRYVRTRIPVGANPRAIAVSPDGRLVAVANRLDDSVSLIDTTTDAVTETISLVRAGDRPVQGEDKLFLEGERLFHSGRLSFSGQFSCASCHPDGHADGLNWDLPADGFNNFHNTKSLLGNASTAPYGWLGTSPTLRDRFTGTLRHLFQHEPTESETTALEAYLLQLRYPDRVADPAAEHLPGIAGGKSLFEGAAGCALCHSGPKHTDRQLHDVGTGSDGETEFDTPALERISTTTPYLHDGRAATLESVLTRHNAAGLHGRAAEMSAGQLADLVEYLKSL
jgi:YVTN family beta-propeller protein